MPTGTKSQADVCQFFVESDVAAILSAADEQCIAVGRGFCRGLGAYQRAKPNAISTTTCWLSCSPSFCDTTRNQIEAATRRIRRNNAHRSVG
jgi:hypothetical protein